MITKHFINLTNGIECIPNLNEKGIHYEFIRIQSTSIESKSWLKLFYDLDHNFLMNLALDYTCIVYDAGANKKTSKTIWYGIPLIKYVLNKLWYNKAQKAYMSTKKGTINVTDYFDIIYTDLFVFDDSKQKALLKQKLSYYKKFLQGRFVRLEGVSIQTKNDGDIDYFLSILNKSIEESTFNDNLDFVESNFN